MTTKLSAAISSSSSSSSNAAAAASAANIPYNNNNNKDYPGFEEGEEYNYQESTTMDVVGNDNDRTVVVRVALPSMERFRNLTRAIEYSVAHDDDNDDDDGEFDEENGNRYINRSRNNRSSSLRLKKLFFSLFERRFHNLKNGRLSSRPLPSTTASMRQRMIRDERNNNQLFIILRRLFAWFHRRIFGQQIQKRGFRRTDISGKKRHFALLVASMLSGMGGIRPINLSSSDAAAIGGGFFDTMDASVYHERMVHTAHHHRVASYSSSSVYDTMGGASAFLGSLSSNAIQQQKYIKRWMIVAAAKKSSQAADDDKREVERDQQ